VVLHPKAISLTTTIKSKERSSPREKSRERSCIFSIKIHLESLIESEVDRILSFCLKGKKERILSIQCRGKR
jgi:hypothetical protein